MVFLKRVVHTDVSTSPCSHDSINITMEFIFVFIIYFIVSQLSIKTIKS
jgi:hypothetical protein